jgi:hypothetical protein
MRGAASLVVAAILHAAPLGGDRIMIHMMASIIVKPEHAAAAGTMLVEPLAVHAFAKIG